MIRQFPVKGTGLFITETASSLRDAFALPLVLFGRCMTITPIEDVAFDDATTFAMGEAFDRTCESIRIIGSSVPVREIIAKQIIDAAKNGERDPARLYEQALIIFGIVDLSKLLISVGDPPIPAYASVTHAA